jgi:hypothetical protein
MKQSIHTIVFLFQKKGILHAIMGFICMLYPFIWGLMHFGDPEIKKPMTIWLVVIGVSIVLSIIGAVTSGSGSTGFLPFFM